MATGESSTPTLVSLPTSPTTAEAPSTEHVIPHPNTAVANTPEQHRRSKLPLPPGFTASDYRITCSTRREYSSARNIACKAQSVQKRLEIHQHFVRKLKAAAQVERQDREDLRDSMVKASEMGYTGPVGRSGEKEWDSVWKVYSSRSRTIRSNGHGDANKQDTGFRERPEGTEEVDQIQEEQYTPVVSGWCEKLEHPLPPEAWPLGYLRHHSDQIEGFEHLTDPGTYISTSDEGDEDTQRLLQLLPSEGSVQSTLKEVRCGSGAKHNIKRFLKKLRRKKKIRPETGSMPTTWSTLAVKRGLLSSARLSASHSPQARSAIVPAVLQRPVDDSHAYAGARAQENTSQTQLPGSHAYTSSLDPKEGLGSETYTDTSTGITQRARSIPLVQFDSHGRMKLPSQLELLLDQVNKGNEQNGVQYAEPFKALPDTESVENLRLTCGARLDKVSKEAAQEARDVIREERELQLRDAATIRNTMLNRATTSTPTRANTSIPSSDKGPNGVYSPSGSTYSRLPTPLQSGSPTSPTSTNVMDEPTSSSPSKTQSSTPSPKSTTTSKSTPPSLLPRLSSSPPSRKATPIKSKPDDKQQEASRLRKMYNKISKDTSTSNIDVYANSTPPESDKKVRFTIFQDADSSPFGEGAASRKPRFFGERNASAKLKLRRQWEEQEEMVLEEARELVREDERERARADARLRET